MVYKALCLSGGGITGFVHLGVIKYLEEKNLTKNLDTIVCTSIGAVVGTLYALGLSADDIYEKLSGVTHDILQYSTIDDFFNVFGMDSGEYFMAQIIDILIAKKISPLITLSEVKNQYGKQLVITGTNVSKHKTVYFSYETHGSMRVLDAMRISISIPFLFSVATYEGDFYVDGGITDNYPVLHCINLVANGNPEIRRPSDYVIGSYVESMNPRLINNIEDYIYSIFACCLKKNSEEIPLSTIAIPITDISSVDFDVDVSKRKNMYEIGYVAAQKYIENTLYVQAGKYATNSTNLTNSTLTGLLSDKSIVNSYKRKRIRSFSV